MRGKETSARSSDAPTRLVPPSLLRAASDFTGPRIISLLLTRINDRIGPRKPELLFLARRWALAEDRDASRRVVSSFDLDLLVRVAEPWLRMCQYLRGLL